MELTPEIALLVPLVVGIIEAFKQIGLGARFAPVAALALGVLGAVLLGGGFDTTSLFQGVLAGLSASGLYSGVRTTMKL